MEDKQIVRLFFSRSEQAVEALDRKYGRILTGLALRILGDRQDAEECVNDAYLAAWNTIPPQDPDPLLTYICRIVRNRSLKRYRTNTAACRSGGYDLALEELEAVIPAAGTPEQAVDAMELSQAINDFLGGLDVRSRVLFVRRYWYADSIADMAARYGMNAHNVSVRLSRTRKKLETYLRRKGVSL